MRDKKEASASEMDKTLIFGFWAMLKYSVLSNSNSASVKVTLPFRVSFAGTENTAVASLFTVTPVLAIKRLSSNRETATASSVAVLLFMVADSSMTLGDTAEIYKLSSTMFFVFTGESFTR